MTPETVVFLHNSDQPNTAPTVISTAQSTTNSNNYAVECYYHSNSIQNIGKLHIAEYYCDQIMLLVNISFASYLIVTHLLCLCGYR